MKKGFTLVELLGVIVILGLLGLIVFPNVAKSIKNSKEKLYREQVLLIENSARSWGMQNNDILKDRDYIPLEKLITDGFITKKDIKDPRNEETMNGCVVVNYDTNINQYTYEYTEDSCEIAMITPESCFTFDSNTGTITEYNDSCPKDVVIPDTIAGVNVTAIGDNAFSNKKLISVKLPSQLNSIGLWGFSSNKLTSIILPEGLVTIGNAAFYHNQIAEIVIPSTVTTIMPRAFDSNLLTNVTIPPSVTVLDNMVFCNNKLNSIEIPETVTSIGWMTFMGNELSTVTIPESVKILGANGGTSFYNNQLTSVTIKGKSSSAEFELYAPNWGWAEGYSDANIIWNG